MRTNLDMPPVMRGATAGAAGRRGLVPKPAAGDQDKALFADKTWRSLNGTFKGGVAGASVPATETAAGDWYYITAAGTSQSKTWAVGDRAVYDGSSGNWTQIATQAHDAYNAPSAIAAAGNTNLALGAGQSHRVEKIAVAAGSAAYTHTLTIQNTNAVAGYEIEGQVSVAASTNPLIELRNLTSGGTLLGAITGDTVARLWNFRARFDGTNWFLTSHAKQRAASIDELNAMVNALAPRQALDFDGARLTSVKATLTNGPSFGTADFTLLYWYRPRSFSGSGQWFVSWTGNAPTVVIAQTTGLFKVYDTTHSYRSTDFAVPLNKWTLLGMSRTGGVASFTANAEPTPTPTLVDAENYTGTINAIGGTGNPDYSVRGSLIPLAYNYALSNAEIRALYDHGGPLPEHFCNAGTTRTAGAFLIGRRYRIATAGSTDFTAVGAANSTAGTEFVATGAGTGTGTAIALGCIWAPDPRVDGSARTWQDTSGSAVPITINLPTDGVTWTIPSTAAMDLLPLDGVYAVVGREANVYFDNLIPFDARDFYWRVVSGNGIQQAERWTAVPGGAGTDTLTIEIYHKLTAAKLATQSYPVKIAAASARSGVTPKVLVIGDSLTSGGVYTGEILTIAAGDVFKPTCIGTQGSGVNKHEGHSGWTVNTFYTDASSPFVNAGSFDFANYLSANGLAMASGDYVLIHLGTNDVGTSTTDANTRAIAAAACVQLDAAIANIKATVSGIKIGICVITPPSTSQDAFGANYLASGLVQFQNRRAFDLWNRIMIAHFTGQQGSNIFLVPVGINLDTLHNMVLQATQNVNSRNTEQIIRQGNGVHPDTSGYYQMADAFWAFLKNL